MFSGIVEAIGTIRSVEDRETTRRFRVEANRASAQLIDRHRRCHRRQIDQHINLVGVPTFAQ